MFKFVHLCHGMSQLSVTTITKHKAANNSGMPTYSIGRHMCTSYIMLSNWVQPRPTFYNINLSNRRHLGVTSSSHMTQQLVKKHTGNADIKIRRCFVVLKISQTFFLRRRIFQNHNNKVQSAQSCCWHLPTSLQEVHSEDSSDF